MAQPVHILINTPSPALGEAWKGAFPSPGFDVTATAPGDPFLEAAARIPPDIAVVDFADGRETTAELEVELLQTIRPDVRIIRIGRTSIDP